MTENELTYWAFLCHSQQDNCENRSDAPDGGHLCWGDWLHHELKSFSIPAVFTGQINARGEIISERIEPVFQDKEEQPGNASLSESVRLALDQSKCLIVICSPRSAQSLQVNEQVRYFKQLGRSNRILPFVIAGIPNASDGGNPGVAPEDECFVPALRHPLKPDGTLDTSRRERNSIFADARLGAAKREILANDRQNGEIELEVAKIQLIAGLIGVGFNGLWAHELKRRFAEAQVLAQEARAQNQEGRSPDHEAQSQLLEAQRQAREALGQIVEARNQARAAEAKVLEAQQLAREAQSQLEAARLQVREVQNQAVEGQNLSPDVKSQLEEMQHKLQAAEEQARNAQSEAEEARQQARELENKFLESQHQVSQAQNRVQEIENQARQTQGQLEEAHNLARAAEAKVLETQQRARETESQLEAARQQVREAQNQVLEVQNLPQDIKRQIEEMQNQLQGAQDQARSAQSQATEAHQQAQALENKFLESQNQVSQAQAQVQELEGQARQTQSQLAEAQSQARTAESKVLATEQQVREAQNQIAEARQQAQELQARFLESQNQVSQAQSRIQEIEGQARHTQNQLEAAENKVLETQQQVREAQNQVAETRQQAQELHHKFLAAQHKIQEIESQNHAAQGQIQTVQSQALEAQDQVRTTQNQVLELQNKMLAARRRTQAFAVLTVLALVATGASVWQRKQATPSPVMTVPPEAIKPEVATGPLSREQIQQALQKVSGGGQDQNQLRSLDELVTRIPAEEISNTLGASSALLAGPSLSHFQELLLDAWMKTNAPAAFDWSCQLTDTNSRQRALEKIIPALTADNPTNTLARLNELQPAPDDQTYVLFFQRWAAADPVLAIAGRQQISGHDADGHILSAIMLVWVDQQPAAALSWLESQPDSDALPTGTVRNIMIAALFDVWAAKDLEAATTACQQLPEGPAKEKAWENVLSQRIVKIPAAAADSVTNLVAGDYRQKAIAELCRHWGEADAPAALAWVPSLPVEEERVVATNQIIVSWAGKDPQAATQFAGQHPELSGAVLGDMASAWSQRDLSATTNWVSSLPDGEKKDTVLLALASATTERAPILAAQLCTLVATNQPTTAQVQGIAASLAKVDITNAVEWARGLKDDSSRKAALSGLAETWAQNDPQGMATNALALPAGDLQKELLTAACRQLAKRDLPGMVELLQPLADASLRQSILESAGRGCDLLHLDQTAKYIATMPAGDDQKAALKGLVSTWTANDPEAVLNWLTAFPGTNAQPEQVQLVLKTWAQPEPAAVAKWLAALPVGTASDEMVGAFLEGATVKYPSYAAQWTQSVTNETQRQKFQVQVAQEWMKRDASAATNWINSLNWPDELKQQMKAPSP